VPGSFNAAERKRREAALMARGRPKAGGSIRAEKKGGWGKPIAITLFLLALIAVGVAHVMPIDVSDYQSAATDALRRPVKIGSANLSLVTGLQLKFHDVQIGDTRLPLVRAFPEIGSLTGPKKIFSRIEIEGGKLEQGAVGDALFAKVQADNFSVGRIVARNIELAGPLAIPKGMELEANYDAEGNVRGVVVRGPQALLARIARKGEAAEFDASASTFTLPFAPEIALSTFSMKGRITPKGMTVQEWDGQTLNGTVSGTANVRWGDNWTVDGVLTARNINAAVFAPALLSDGRGEGSGKFSMRGEPGKLARTGRIDGTFTVSRGVLGSIDLAKAIQTGGKSGQGRTQFNEMTGQASYDRGALALRSVTISAGQLNAGASVDISEKGALSGRIVADVKIASQQQRATLLLGGTLQEPLVKN
jgi:AsmA-like C-terminal region